MARVLENVPLPDRSGRDPFDTSETLKHLVLVAFAMRTIDRDAYDKLMAEEFDLFQAAASFRKKLNVADDSRYPGDHLTALVLCLDFNRSIDVSDEAFIERFVQVGVGDAALGAEIHRMCKGMKHHLFRAMPSLEHIDSLLSLTA